MAQDNLFSFQPNNVNDIQQGLLSAFNPSDAYSQSLRQPVQGDMTLGNLVSYFMPISRNVMPYEDSPRLGAGDYNFDFPQVMKDAYSGIDKFGQAFRGELSPQELQQLAFDTSMNVTGGSLLGSRVIPNAVPEGILGMGVSSSNKSLKSIDDIKRNYPNVDLRIYSSPKGLTLSKIVVPKEARSEGIGSSVMSDLVKYADKNNLPIALTPDSSFGGSKTRLKSFYRKFGFKDNKGRNKDFSFRETMIRQPQTGLLGKANQVTPETSLLGKVDNVQPKSGVSEVVPPTDKADGIFAFHGSGADFDEFKLSKIGTGEGNQAFGYGLYFTDSKDIAKFYKNQLRKRESVKYKEKPIKTIADANFFDELNLAKIQDRIFSGKSFNEAKSSLVNELEQTLENFNKNDPIGLRMFKTEKKALDHAKSLKEKDFKYQSGKTYEVKIKAVMDDLIDYDKSLRQQNDKVKKILKPYYEYYSVAETADFGTLLESAYRHLPQDEFSERLAKQGIKGIKYKAGQLSGITDSKATNYVIFDDKIIDIMKKYGIVGAVGVTAMQGGDQSSEANLSL